ncbi:MAG: hypothetical protein MJZ21_01635 [archaeon]|nr:hypothetical protein [archaeon]
MDRIKGIINRCRYDIMYRNVMFLRANTVMTTLLAVFMAIMGILSDSVFFYALAVYYLAVISIRYALVTGTDADLKNQWRRYRYSACVLLVITLIVLILNMFQILGEYALSYPWYLIYGVALVCFIEVISASIAFFTNRRHVTPVILAMKNCNVIVAAVSLLSLQYSLNAKFGGEPNFTMMMGASMGFVIFGMIIVLSIYMIRNSTRKINGE